MKSKGLVFLAVVLLLLSAQAGFAQEDVSKYPSKPITYICPSPPGLATDTSIRLLAKELEKILGQPVVVVNKPGAALTIGTAAVATAKPDGYTIGFTGGPPLYFTPLLQKVPYDPFKDLRMVAQYGGCTNGAVFVKGDSPFKSFKDVIAYARQNPKKVTYGTTGANSITHITLEAIAKQENVQLTHIPFKGTPEAQSAVLGGHVSFAAGDFVVDMVGSGQIKLLMMLREDKSEYHPEIPILKDLGYNIPYAVLGVVMTQKSVPDPIVRKLEEAVVKAMKEPAFVKGMKDLRLQLTYRSGKEMDAYNLKSNEYYTKVFKEMGLLIK
ncbi:MAG: tripartite tricarboxylate transporter substrate binding protein [Deltaproteobacteria bacterium]|nr:tripartite tricarboxylate transporter substrate binding protein [Deltaproteobacteria bacterium]